MGAPDLGIQAAEQSMADSLLTAFRTIKPSERQRHVAVLDYWLSIRGEKEFPPLHDLDPLEISDAGPNSILLELIGGGQDAEIRHLGEALQDAVTVSRVIDAPSPSLLSSIARKLPIVSISREFLAFEDSFTASTGLTRCWVTLLPLSSCGSWVDYVYAFVSLDSTGSRSAVAPEPEPEAVAEEMTEPEVAAVEPTLVDDPAEEIVVPEEAEHIETAEVEDEPLELSDQAEAIETAAALPPEEAAESPAPKGAPGFSKLLDGLANLTGFYGQGVNVDAAPTLELTDDSPVEAEAPSERPVEETSAEVASVETVGRQAEPEDELQLVEPDGATPEIASQDIESEIIDLPKDEPAQPTEAQADLKAAPTLEGPLQDQLAQVRAKAEEAREAQLRVTQALHESLSAAYDFALDAENCPEEYLRLVESQGVKIQLRAPMAPVARMAFNDVCDTATIRQFESVLAWALKVELPRGALLERIEKAGGIPELLNEFARAA
jgi:hypothetical protein